MNRLKLNNFDALRNHIRVIDWMTREHGKLLDAARAEAAAGIGIQDDTMDSFLFLDKRLSHYAFTRAAGY